jgi:hypothetical protein
MLQILPVVKLIFNEILEITPRKKTLIQDKTERR